jgi:hypothetical protein
MLNSNCFSRRTLGLFWTLSARKHITCFIFYLSFLSFWHVSFNYYFIKLNLLYCIVCHFVISISSFWISNFHDDDARFSTDHNTEYHHMAYINTSWYIIIIVICIIIITSRIFVCATYYVMIYVRNISIVE